MKTIEELRESLASLFEQIKDGSVDVKVAAEMNNTAGKMINTLKVQIEYAALKKEAPKIAFLEGELSPGSTR
jgi:hypothetical protein